MRFFLCTLCLALAANACRDPRKSVDQPPPPRPSVSAPTDHLAATELAPGEEELFGLVLPRGMRVQGRFSDTGLAYGPIPADALVEYIRARIEAKQVELGKNRTTFPSAHVLRAPTERAVRIEVQVEGTGSRLLLRDLSLPAVVPPAAGLTDEERWRRAGFTPDGKPLNRKALE